MLRIGTLLLPSFILGALSASSIVDFQEQFSELSRSVEPQLLNYRTKNGDVRGKLIHRTLEALGNLTAEMRNITRDYWTRIESHELANPECLERIQVEFDYYVWSGGLHMQYLAYELHWDLRDDAMRRFNPVVSQVQRENSRPIYQTVQTLERNQFLAGTVYELQDKLDYYQNLWEANQERLQQELANVQYLVERIEANIEWWYNYIVTRHHMHMGYQLDSVNYKCVPEHDTNNAGSLPITLAKLFSLYTSLENKSQ